MHPLRIGPYHLLHDPNATRAAHALRRNDGPPSCGCAYCRNWIAARPETYANPAFRQLLETLGLSLDGETEVCQLPLPNSGLHLYDGWFHFVGHLTAQDPAGEDDLPPDLYPLSSFSARRDVLPDPLTGHPVVQLQINAQIPWVLDEPDPG